MDRLMVNRLIQIDYNTGGTASSGTEDGELLCRNTWVTVWAAEKRVALPRNGGGTALRSQIS
jgi:hypothetical protein